MGAKSVKMVAPFFVPKLIGEPHGAFLTPQTINCKPLGRNALRESYFLSIIRKPPRPSQAAAAKSELKLICGEILTF